MRSPMFFLLLASLFASGCGMGKNASSAFTIVGGSIPSGGTAEAGGKINLENTSPLTIEKGKTAKWLIKAERKDTKNEKMYKGDIQLEFNTKDVPGIKIEPAVIPAGQDSIEIAVTAAPDAEGGGFIKVIAKGKGTEPTEIEVRPTIR